VSETEFDSYERNGLSLSEDLDDETSQRSHKRMRWARSIQVSWLAGDSPKEPVTLKSHDLSRGGLALIGRGMVHPGTKGIVLLDKGGGEVMLRCIEVTHCRYVGRLTHIFGAKWVPMPNNVVVKTELTDNGPKLVLPHWD